VQAGATSLALDDLVPQWMVITDTLSPIEESPQQ
jgi:hypothetical protein